MKNTPFKLRSGNRAAYGDLQKESPVKIIPILAGIAKVAAAVGKGVATAAKVVGAKAAATKVGGTLLTATGKGATTKIGLTKTGQAVASSLTSSALSGGKKKKGVKPIIEGKQEKIMS